MSSTANNLPLVPGNWRSGNESTMVVHSPSHYGWSRPSAAPGRAHAHAHAHNRGFVREEDVGNSTYNHLRSPNAENWIPGSNSDVRRVVPRTNSYTWNRIPHAPPPPLPYNRPHELSGRTQDPWRSFEDRVRTGPYGLNGFPSHPFSPMRIIVLDNQMAPPPEVNPRLRQFIQESPPRIRGQWNTQLASDDEESKLSREEQNKALKKLKKQVYKPFPKDKNKRWGLYYRDTASFNKREEEEQDDDEGNSCAICLEDFVPKQEVMVTPCKHMFHEDCIVRWVKSNGQCPVCRFALGEQRRETALRINNSNPPRSVQNDLTTGDLLSLIRAMEEAFEWVHVPR